MEERAGVKLLKQSLAAAEASQETEEFVWDLDLNPDL